MPKAASLEETGVCSKWSNIWLEAVRPVEQHLRIPTVEEIPNWGDIVGDGLHVRIAKFDEGHERPCKGSGELCVIKRGASVPGGMDQISTPLLIALHTHVVPGK